MSQEGLRAVANVKAVKGKLKIEGAGPSLMSDWPERKERNGPAVQREWREW